MSLTVVGSPSPAEWTGRRLTTPLKPLSAPVHPRQGFWQDLSKSCGVVTIPESANCKGRMYQIDTFSALYSRFLDAAQAATGACSGPKGRSGRPPRHRCVAQAARFLRHYVLPGPPDASERVSGPTVGILVPLPNISESKCFWHLPVRSQEPASLVRGSSDVTGPSRHLVGPGGRLSRA